MPFQHLLLSCLLLLSTTAVAEPVPFELYYSAKFNNLQADAVRVLQPRDDGTWSFVSTVDLKLLNQTVTRIEESSEFGWRDDLPASRHYHYKQSGLGARERGLEFSKDGAKVDFSNNAETGSYPLSVPTFDGLNMLLALAHGVRAGDHDIEFPIAERSDLNAHHYQVVEEEALQTPLGSFKSVHLRRVRPPGDARTTDLWLAKDYDYVLLKLVQHEPGGDTVILDLRDGRWNGKSLKQSAGAATGTTTP